MNQACAVCRLAARSVGVLCDRCRGKVAAPFGFVPQQIISGIERPCGDALVDPWGNAHALSSQTPIGRHSPHGITIHDALVSRHHARLTRRFDTWTLRDLRSANGTFANDTRIATTELDHGDRITIADVGFFLVREMATPMRDPDRRHDCVMMSTADDEATKVGFAVVSLQLSSSIVGDGGVLRMGNSEVQLSSNQFRLISLLGERMVRELDRSMRVRGFVSAAELLDSLTWSSEIPRMTQLVQLVLRTRHQLVHAGLGDLLEMQHQLGYRLRVIPRLA